MKETFSLSIYAGSNSLSEFTFLNFKVLVLLEGKILSNQAPCAEKRGSYPKHFILFDIRGQEVPGSKICSAEVTLRLPL